MPIEIRLKAILHRYGLDTPGVVTKIAKELGVHRHTIGKLYRCQLKNPSLDVLDRLCDWLVENGVPASELPRELFGFRAMKFWDSIAASQNVTFYLGEYIQETTDSPRHLQRWISRWDADAVNRIIQHLSRPSVRNPRRDADAADGAVKHPIATKPPQDSHPQLRTLYAAFRAGITKKVSPRAAEFTEDVKASRALFERMRNQPGHDTSIIIGSQRVNYLLEHFVADLFGREPFQPGAMGTVPFYLRYRTSDRAVPSCFGGLDGSPRHESPGVYYLTDQGSQWVQCPWEPRKQDAGIVIVVHEPGKDAMEIALFGYSGWSTVVIGRQLDQDVKPFWPPAAQWRGKEVGVYICQITFRPLDGPDADLAVPEADSFEVIPIDKAILEDRLS